MRCFTCVNEVIPGGHSSLAHVVIGGIMFQVDTDNRSNFPTERSFHAFKKQRSIDVTYCLFCLLDFN